MRNPLPLLLRLPLHLRSLMRLQLLTLLTVRRRQRRQLNRRRIARIDLPHLSQH